MTNVASNDSQKYALAGSLFNLQVENFGLCLLYFLFKIDPESEEDGIWSRDDIFSSIKIPH